MTIKRLEVSAPPLIKDEDLELVDLPRISMSAMNNRHTLLESMRGDLKLYKGNISKSFVSGKQFGDEFVPVVQVLCKKPNYPGANIPSQLSNNWTQVSMVNVDRRAASFGYTKATYEAISKHFDLVSDREQYWAAKKLWQSLARSNAHIYVWDGNVKDYLRDHSGKPHKYDGQNIPETTIWGKTTEHARRLLVATHKQLI